MLLMRLNSMPIISMLEEIRSSLMERMYTKYTIMLECDDSICPIIRKRIEDYKLETRFWTVKPVVGNMV